MLVASVTPALSKTVSAGKLIGELAQMVGGKGGGRPDFARRAETTRQSWRTPCGPCRHLSPTNSEEPDPGSPVGGYVGSFALPLLVLLAAAEPPPPDERVVVPPPARPILIKPVPLESVAVVGEEPRYVTHAPGRDRPSRRRSHPTDSGRTGSCSPGRQFRPDAAARKRLGVRAVPPRGSCCAAGPGRCRARGVVETWKYASS